MESFFASGHAVDTVLAVLALEAVLLRRRGWRTGAIATALLPAVLILAGLRAALTGAAWPWIAGPLALSFPVHLLDLVTRERQRRNAAPTPAPDADRR